MILKSKICGVSDLKILKFIVNHNHPPQFIGFIVNYPKSKRYVNIKKLKEIFKIDKKKSLYVAVLVDPEKKIRSPKRLGRPTSCYDRAFNFQTVF